MKRDLIYLTLIVSAIWAAHATAKAVQDGPQQIEPRKIEAGFTKTVHILFPSPVTYIDIGSMDIIAGKADGAENVVRVKAAVRNFAAETNLTVITEDGGFFTFDVHYAENPAVSTLNLTGTATRKYEETGCCGLSAADGPSIRRPGAAARSRPRKARNRKTHVERHIPPKPYGREGHSCEEVRH